MYLGAAASYSSYSTTALGWAGLAGESARWKGKRVAATAEDWLRATGVVGGEGEGGGGPGGYIL